MSYIEVRNLKKDYVSGEIVNSVLKNVNLNIEKGEFVSLIGASGSGKTTLLNLIGCLDQCTSGTIKIDGTEVTKKTLKELCVFRRENLGYVFQAYNLIPVLTAYENVEYPLVLLKVPAAKRKAMVEEMLDKVGLKEKMHDFPKQMSGGQQQRVSIARALVSKPAIVIADEPTANLDSVNGKMIVELMKKLNEELGITFLFSTHDQSIMEYFSRVIHIRDGVFLDDKK